ncbi:hypothetical protein [Xanthomonas phage RTH11]|nr:hypothetical protein [Xanthomonas phage RTH11]
MLIVIAIQDIWKRFGEDSQALQNIGLQVEDVVKLAYGYACLTNRPYAHEAMIPVSANIFTAVRDLLVDRLPFDDRLPFTRQSGYGVNDQVVHRVVDIVGEISQMLSDAVIRQVGHFPAGLILQRLMGPDLVLYYNTEDSRVPHPFAESRTS